MTVSRYAWQSERKLRLISPNGGFWRIRCMALCACCISLATMGSAQTVPAFFGAEGAGAKSVGGRAGRVIEVVNLNAEGPGSLKEALEASGPRTVVFRVGGTIDWGGAKVRVTNPYLTIAGQTAPGDGICIRNGQLYIRTHDVVMRYLRVRSGMGHCIFLEDGTHSVIIDHCSFSWATDENVTLYSVDSPLRDITFSWCISSEGVRPEATQHNVHGAGIIVGSVRRADLLENIDVHHNLFAHNQFRNPYIKGKSARVINNITYDWEFWSMLIRAGITVDIIGNHFKLGPSFSPADWTHKESIIWSAVPGDNGNYGVPGTPSIYIAGNRDEYRDNDPDEDNWDLMDAVVYLKTTGKVDRTFERKCPQPAGPFPITVHRVEDLDRVLLPSVGASRHLDDKGEWVSIRDSVDERVIADYVDGTGILPSKVADVGGYPELSGGIPYVDSDHDGMPDAWEIANGFDPSDASDGGKDADADGYTNLEESLNGTDPHKSIAMAGSVQPSGVAPAQ